MSLSNTKYSSTGPELRGGNITLDRILAKTDPQKRQSKIVCTMGPACWEVPQLEELIDAGLSVARFNFSHGDHEGHLACLKRLREAAANQKKNVGMYQQSRNVCDATSNDDAANLRND
jgi:pyruvate kinase